MKFRCPYCRKTFEKARRGQCPSCKKYVRIPGRLKEDEGDGRKRRKKGSPRPGTTMTPARMAGGGRSTLTVFLILGVFLVIAGLLVRETARIPGTPVEDWRPGLAQEDVDVLAQALEHYKRDCGHYPPAEDGLLALVKDPGTWGWEGPYVTLMRPDPWGNLYQYGLTNKVATVFSMGIDGKAGTGDDIVPTPVEKAVAETAEDAPPEE